MALSHIPLEGIEEQHLQNLISVQTAETLYIEYKRQTYGPGEADRKEFLADISSFANASGGDLVIGIEEAGGVPTALRPFTGNADQECRRLEQMARDGVEPRITGLQVRAVPLATGGAVIILRIPKSYNPPHRVILKGSNRFYARASSGKFQPNVEELRNMFTAAPQLAERIQTFRTERLGKIAAGEVPAPAVARYPLLIQHIVPYSAFDLRQSLYLDRVKNSWGTYGNQAYLPFANWRINFDGLFSLSNGHEGSNPGHYAQLFRSGIVEIVMLLDRAQPMPTQEIEAIVVRNCFAYANALHQCGIEPPHAVLASLLNVTDMVFGNGLSSATNPLAITHVTAERDQYLFVESVLDRVPTSDQETGPLLRPTLDHIASLAGRATSSAFDQDGNYTLRM